MAVEGDLGVDCVQSNPAYDFKTYLDNSGANGTVYDNVDHSCTYYEPEDFHHEFCHGDRKFSTFSLNVRSLPNKWCDFRDIVSNLNGNNFKFSIVAIQEVWNVPLGMTYDLPGYKPFCYKIRDPLGRNNNAGGGIGLWIDDGLEYEEIEELSIFEPNFF